MNGRNFRIAIATNDGDTVSAHFGRAHFFEVIEVRDGKETRRERRDARPRHDQEGRGSGGHDHGGMRRHVHHEDMLDTVGDCDAVVAGGMGVPMFERIGLSGKEAIVTRTRMIDDVVRQALDGTLSHDPLLVHAHGRMHG